VAKQAAVDDSNSTVTDDERAQVERVVAGTPLAFAQRFV
jgi:hypothetical protein